MIKRNKEMFIFFGLVLLTYILGFVLSINNKVETPKTTELETTTECEIETETFIEVVELDNADLVEVETEIEVETEPQYVSLGIYTITAYCSCNLCCPGWAENRPNGIVYGASGEELIDCYSIAVDTDVIPFGETIYINDRPYMAMDRGSAIKGNRIDIYMSSHDKALQWGVQNIEIFREVRNIFE